MDSIPSGSKATVPGSPDANFEFMRKFKKNQISARSRESRIWKKKSTPENFSFYFSISKIFTTWVVSAAEIKLKLKVSRWAWKSGAFKHPISSVEKLPFTVDDGKLAQRGPECRDPLNVSSLIQISVHISSRIEQKHQMLNGGVMNPSATVLGKLLKYWLFKSIE